MSVGQGCISVGHGLGQRAPYPGIFSLLLAVCWLPGEGTVGAADTPRRDAFTQPVSWKSASYDEAYVELLTWLDAFNTPVADREDVASAWQRDRGGGIPPVEAAISCLSLVREDVREVVETMRMPRQSLELPSFACLDDSALPERMRENLCLLFGRWLAAHDLLEEARDRLQPLSEDRVLDPPMLLFYRGVVAYRLIDKPTCVSQLQPLIDHRELVPRRYVALAQLMVADIKPVKTDTLDEVSRIMERIRLRLGHGRAGTRVRKEEEDVIAKLDKMIKQAEQQLQQQQSLANGEQAGGNAPTQPMNQSVPGGVSGPGDVDPRDQGERTTWGNLPPKEREEALQQLGKDVPSHYRDVIEEYFRTLAREGTDADNR